MSVKILHGDCRDVLATMPAESVHCVVTSPPYWGLRDYGVAGQIGLEKTPEQFVAQMVDVFRQVWRVLRTDGTVFLNLGDSYFGGGRGGGSEGSKQRTNVGALIKSTDWSKANGGVRRVAACDTVCKEPVNYPTHDCLCQSLCDVCRAAYRIGRAHNGRSLASMPSVSNSVSNQERMEPPFDRAPTSGLVRQPDRSEGATHDLSPSSRHEGEPLPFSQASMRCESFQQHQEANRQSGQTSGCRLCGCSLLDCVRASAHMEACNCGTVGGASDDRMIGMGTSGSAYQEYTTAALKPKDLVGIPWRVAFALQAAGWWLRQDIVWSKINPMPESVTDRCTKAHEYIFLLSKSKNYYFDQGAILEDCSPNTHARLSQDVQAKIGSDRVPGKTNGTMKAVLRKQDSTNESFMPGATEHSGLHRAGSPRGGRESWNGSTFDGPRDLAVRPDTGRKRAPANSGIKNNDSFDAAMAIMPLKRNKRSVWEVTTQPFSEAHFATFPPKLIEPCILAGCPVGGTVLDPFGGAGTTGLVADRLKRNAILIELNPEYAAMAKRRIKQDAGLFAQVEAVST